MNNEKPINEKPNYIDQSNNLSGLIPIQDKKKNENDFKENNSKKKKSIFY